MYHSITTLLPHNSYKSSGSVSQSNPLDVSVSLISTAVLLKKNTSVVFWELFSPQIPLCYLSFYFFIFALHLLCVSFLISLCIFVFLCAFVAFLYFSGLFLCCSLFDLSGPPYSALHIVGLRRKIHLTCTCII